MQIGMTRAYHHKWLRDRSMADKIGLSDRAVRTVQRLFENVLHREFRGSLLDLGSGDGSFCKSCQKVKGIQAVGIDIADGVDFECDKLPYEDRQFDIVFMYSVIEHIGEPANILSEIRRVLTEDGILIIITPNLDTARLRFFDDPTHVKPYNPRSITWLMSMFGFQKKFIGLWTVNKSPKLWKLPEYIQFLYGSILPFTGLHKLAPPFLKGASMTMLCAFSVQKGQHGHE